jgi:hypothetical protein
VRRSRETRVRGLGKNDSRPPFAFPVGVALFFSENGFVPQFSWFWRALAHFGARWAGWLSLWEWQVGSFGNGGMIVVRGGAPWGAVGSFRGNGESVVRRGARESLASGGVEL